MIIYALWHGGSSYACGSVADDVETFASVEDACDALGDRAARGYWQRQTFTYTDGRTEHDYTPNADESPSMWIWHYDPRDLYDPYPDLIITLDGLGDAHVCAA